MRSFTLVVNPVSGGGAGPRTAVAVARGLRESGARVEVVYSPRAGAAPELARAAVDAGDAVVSVGGDGMLASLAGPVAAAGGELGIAPAGRGNDFARMLGLDADPNAVVATLLTGRADPVDLLDVDGRIVAGSVYAGVDAAASLLVDRLRSWPSGVQYPVAAVTALARFTPHRYRLVVDSDSHELDAATVVVANSGYYGQGMHIAPMADVRDGLLDVVVIPARGRLGLIRRLPRVYDGRHVESAEVRVFRGREVALSRLSPAPVPVGGDGEPLGELPESQAPRTIRVLPDAVRLIG